MPRDYLEAVGLTDVGNVRQYNEDSIALDPDNGLAILADGMGGHRAGDVASRMATDIVHAGIRTRLADIRSTAHQHAPLLAVDESINRANQAIFESAQADASRQGMGTTLALVLFYDNSVVLGHIGDSRIYRLRGNALQAMTRDDSLLRDQLELGLISAADAVESHNRSLVTQALGVKASVSPHLRRYEALAGDIFLLCSDGLHDLVDDSDIELIIDSLRSNLPLAAQHLVQTAKDNGGYDNVSVVLVKVLRPFAAGPRDGWLARWLRWWPR